MGTSSTQRSTCQGRRWSSLVSRKTRSGPTSSPSFSSKGDGVFVLCVLLCFFVFPVLNVDSRTQILAVFSLQIDIDRLPVKLAGGAWACQNVAACRGTGLCGMPHLAGDIALSANASGACRALFH